MPKTPPIYIDRQSLHAQTMLNLDFEHKFVLNVNRGQVKTITSRETVKVYQAQEQANSLTGQEQASLSIFY